MVEVALEFDFVFFEEDGETLIQPYTHYFSVDPEDHTPITEILRIEEQRLIDKWNQINEGQLSEKMLQSGSRGVVLVVKRLVDVESQETIIDLLPESEHEAVIEELPTTK